MRQEEQLIPTDPEDVLSEVAEVVDECLVEADSSSLVDKRHEGRLM